MRPARDKPDTTKLVQENRRLRRQVSRLKRQVEDGVPLQEQEPVEEDAPQKPRSRFLHCKKCGSADVGSFLTPGGKTVYGCKSCKKWRGGDE